jgi:MATE family multidrug resistance protein
MLYFLWWLLNKKERTKRYVTNIKLFVLDLKMIKKVMSIGLPSAMQMFFEVAIFTAAIWLSGLLGKNHQAANQIALNLSSMTFMVAMGLSVAAMIRVGNQKGLQNFKELRRIAISIFLLGLAMAFVFALLFALFHNVFPTLYVDLDDPINRFDNNEVVTIAAKLLLAAAVFQLSDSAQVIILGALRGLQDVKIPTIITFMAYWVIGFPTSYFLGKEEYYGSFGIWIGLLVGLTTAAILLYIRFNYLSKRLISQNEQN